jgi:peptide/nickel transport system substrate-binding protein
VLRPDLAAELPVISADGLTWTFRLKRGLRYGPPFEGTEIVAGDIVRALERALDPDIGSPYDFYRVIEGAAEYAAGATDSISGLETPDDHSLVVHLERPAGDLGHRLALPPAAPIPPGARDGHDDNYGPFLVASGPYMFEGSEALDFTRSPGEQEPVSGLRPDSVTLVRNPSWDPATDDLREAYVDRIVVSFFADPAEVAPRVDAGEIDFAFDLGTVSPPEQIDHYRSDPELAARVHVDPNDSLLYATMNLAVPPFDDVHVRRAVNLVANRAELRRLLGGPLEGNLPGHIAPDSVEANLLVDYAPYATPGGRGDPEAARLEMAASRYDTDGDGLCDRSVCEGVTLLARSDAPAVADQAEVLRQSLALVGIDARVQAGEDFYGVLLDPKQHVPISIGARWTRDFPNASSFFQNLVDGRALSDEGSFNASLVGASPEQLERWGYSVTSVASVDEKIDQCVPLVGAAQTECWAKVDQLLMEEVVPWVPYLHGTAVRVVSNRVLEYVYDAFALAPAFDRIALREGSN